MSLFPSFLSFISDAQRSSNLCFKNDVFRSTVFYWQTVFKCVISHDLSEHHLAFCLSLVAGLLLAGTFFSLLLLLLLSVQSSNKTRTITPENLQN